MLEIVRQKYGRHVDTRVYLDLGYGEMEVDVEEIEMIDGSCQVRLTVIKEK